MCTTAREETGRVGLSRETLGGLWQVWGVREVAKSCDPSRFSWALSQPTVFLLQWHPEDLGVSWQEARAREVSGIYCLKSLSGWLFSWLFFTGY